ncbi:MAG: Clp protease N-terminal domain-containing protein [Anaerolineae bacterium]
MTPPPDIPEKEIRNRCAGLLSAAAEEAQRLGHNYIGTEHIFIAATKNEEGPTAGLLRRAGLNPRQVRNEIRREIGTGEGLLDEVLPLTPRAEMVLSLAIFMADREESEDVEESHVLLALLQEGEGVPIRKLIEMGFNVNLWLQRLLNEAYEKDLASPDENDLFHLSDLDDFIGDDDYLPSSEHDSKPKGARPRRCSTSTGAT